MTNKIIDAAKAAGGTTYTNRHYPGETACAFGPEALERFYAIAYRQGLDDAALCAAIHCQYPVETDFDRGYGKGSRDASDRIRALKDQT